MGGMSADLLMMHAEEHVAVASMPFIVVGQAPSFEGANKPFSKPHLYDRSRAMLYAIH
jgi:hypothetical protein